MRYSFTHHFRVAWGDMDALGHVNNVAFNRYFESARAEFFLGKLEVRSAGPEKTGPVITRVAMEYRRQVFFPASLEATIGIVAVSSRTFGLGFTLWEEEQCVAQGESEHMWLDFQTGRPTRIPARFRELLQGEKMGDRD